MQIPFALAALLVMMGSAYADDALGRHTKPLADSRFKTANAAHDGHLTLEEAKAGFKAVARHFSEIDANGKGFVTENDIRAWHAAQRLARRSRTPEDPLRPRPAFDRKPANENTARSPFGHNS